MNTISLSKQPRHIIFSVFLPFTAVYFITAFFNQVNAMLAPYLLHDINITASELGITTSIYLLVFALAQIPLGAFLDHFGPRKVQSILFIIASAGILVFAVASNSWLLLLGRALIGIGMSGGLMSGFRALRSWLPKEKIPLANACLMAAGTLGAVFSTMPVEFALQIISWRFLLVLVLILTLGISAWVYFSTPDKHSHTSQSDLTLKQQLLETKNIFYSAYFWKITPMVAFAFGSNMSIVGLWAGPWFSDVAFLNKNELANHLLVISLALVLGIVLWGFIADRLTNKHNWPIARVIGVGIFFYILIQILLLTGSSPANYLIWFMFGFMSRCTTLAYAAISQYFPQNYAGRATTALNMIFFLTAFFTQLGMGIIINFWPSNRMGHYAPHGYYVAFANVICLQIIGLVWFWYHHLKESLSDDHTNLDKLDIKFNA